MSVGLVCVTAVGVDRPGIVAAVTGALVALEANLEDTAMTVLRGHFAMMLVVAVPDDLDPAGVETALEPVADRLGLVVTARPLAAVAAHADPEGARRASLTVVGADRPGIVHQVARALADRAVNVVDLSTRVVGEPGDPAYVMLLEVVLPPDVDPEVVAGDLARVGESLGVHCSLRLVDADIL